MLYSLFIMLETTKNSNNNSPEASNERHQCMATMLIAAHTMADCRPTLWQRGVSDESVILVPCRMIYPLLERATGVQARKALHGDLALQILAVTVQSNADSIRTTLSTTIMDMMHSFEHMAPLMAELVHMIMMAPSHEQQLVTDLLREIGRLDGSDAKANGVKNVAPFLYHIAELQPRIVLQHLPYLLPHLDSESYNLRSAIVNTIAVLLEFMGKNEIEHNNQQQQQSSTGTVNADDYAPLDTSKSRDALLQILHERIYDISSYTRAAALKAWIRLVLSETLPKEALLPVTEAAIDRLQDKTVVVRKQSMQVCIEIMQVVRLMHNNF
jgi:condensin complex subunit 1